MVLAICSGVYSSSYVIMFGFVLVSHPVRTVWVCFNLQNHLISVSELSEIGYSAFDRFTPTFILSLQSTREFIVVLWVLDDFTKVTT